MRKPRIIPRTAGGGPDGPESQGDSPARPPLAALASALAVDDEESSRESHPMKNAHNQNQTTPATTHAAGAIGGGRYFFGESNHGAPHFFPPWYPYPGSYYGHSSHQAAFQHQSSYAMAPTPRGTTSEKEPQGVTHQVSSYCRHCSLHAPQLPNTSNYFVRFSTESQISSM